MGKGDASNGYHVYMDSSTLHFINRSGAKNVAGGTISLSTWTFWEAYYDSVGDVIAVCINRGSDSTLADTVGPTTSTIDFLISQYPSASNYVNGRMCSMVFINGMPATADRDAIYNSGSGVLYKDKPTLSSGTYVSWWDGAETSGVLIDAHGTNHLTDNNTVTSAAGKVTYTAEDASQFTAANSEFLSITNAAQTGLNPGPNTSFYFAGWYYITSFTAFPILFGKGDASTGYHLYLGNSTGATSWVNRAQSKTANGSTILVNTWNFIEAYYDATNDILGMSVNRATDTTVADTVGMSTSTIDLLISKYPAAANYFNGRAANFVFTSGVPTASERDSLYGRGFGVDVSDRPTLSSATYVSWWPLKEASGTREDFIGSNDLTDNNTVTGNPGVVYDASAVSTRGRVIMISNARLVEEPVYA
jgi:hypothetical protein